jgi:GAF domain-containing protein
MTATPSLLTRLPPASQPDTPGCASPTVHPRSEDMPAWLHRLGADLLSQHLTKACFRLEVMCALMDRLQARRVRLWRVRRAPEGRHLHNVGSLRAPGVEETPSQIVTEEQAPAYFKAMSRLPFHFSGDDPLAAGPASILRDPRQPVLNVAVVINGKFVGAVQCWRSAHDAQWSVDDVRLVQRAAAAVGLIVTRHEHKTADRRRW